MSDTPEKKELLERLYEAVFLLQNIGENGTLKTVEKSRENMLEEIDAIKKSIPGRLERIRQKIKKINKR